MPRFHVHRSTQIDASPDKVFEVVSDFATWPTWSPWLLADPEAEVVIPDDASSVGSMYSWKGEVCGQGEIEHINLEPGRLIEEEIRFIKPFKSKSDVSFDLEPVGEGTKVTWHMRGKLPWFMFWMVSKIDTFIGMDYERGLKMLKELIETGAIQSKTIVHSAEPVGPLRVAGVRKTCAMKDIGPSMDASFAEAREQLAKHNLPTDGDMISVYHDCDLKTQMFDYTSGYVLPQSTGEVATELSSWSLPACKALRVEHIGSYTHLGNGWSAANQVARYKKMKQSKVGAYEIYRNNPKDTPKGELKTDIYLPLK